MLKFSKIENFYLQYSTTFNSFKLADKQAIEDELNIDGGKQSMCQLVFKLGIIFLVNIKTIIGFGFRNIRRIVEISASADNTLLDVYNSSDDTQPPPIIVFTNVSITTHHTGTAFVIYKI